MNYKEQLKELRVWDERKEKAVKQSLELRKELERAGENLARIANQNTKDKKMLLTDEEIRLSCCGEGVYWAGERCETASEPAPVLMPQFNNVTKAQLKKGAEILGENSIMFPANINHPERIQSYVGIPLNTWQSLLEEVKE